MIDTVITNTPYSKVTCVEKRGIQPWSLQNQNGSFKKYVKNQTKEQKIDGKYRPRPALIYRFNSTEPVLKCEFSIPKIINRNNVDEITEDDLPELLSLLEERLFDFGIIVSQQDLAGSAIMALHVSKNFVLNNGYTSSYVISELAKTDLSKRLDMSQSTFCNFGESLQYYSNSHSLVFYDKIADFNKPKGRAIDKDKTFYQSSLFDTLKTLQILRMEVRLSKKRKMNKELHKAGFSLNPTLKDVLNNKLCQSILNNYWSEYVSNRLFVTTDLPDNPHRILDLVNENKPNMTYKRKIYLTGLIKLIRSEGGARLLRSKIESLNDLRTWYRYTSDIKLINKIIEDKSRTDWFTQIDEQLKEFKPIKYAEICKVL